MTLFITTLPAENFVGHREHSPFYFSPGQHFQSAYMEVNGRKLAFENVDNVNLEAHITSNQYKALAMATGHHNWYGESLPFEKARLENGLFIVGCPNMADLNASPHSVDIPETGTVKIQVNYRQGGAGVATQILMIFLFNVVTEITATGQILHPFNL